MSSVEIVEVINTMRKPGSAVLAHYDFIKKLEAHPGIAHGNFSGGYFDPDGQVRPCYYLPKREAELMVMSESLDVQTKVYDRLTERWCRCTRPSPFCPGSGARPCPRHPCGPAAKFEHREHQRRQNDVVTGHGGLHQRYPRQQQGRTYAQ